MQIVLPNTIDAGTDITAAELQSNFVAIRDAANGQLEGGGGADNNFKANGVTARELADNLLLHGVPGAELQEGVLAAGDLKVTPGAGLNLNYAAGTAWVRDDSGTLASGALIPVVVGASSVTIAANSSGNPRIDQIILTLTGHGAGSVSVLQGTATVGATIDNRTGAAALPNNAIRLADVLMANGFAGPFVANTSLRDRRPWARGAQTLVTDSGVVQQWSAAGNQTLALAARLELSGAPIQVTVELELEHTLAGVRIPVDLFLNGAIITTATREHAYIPTSGTNLVFTFSWDLIPTAGTNLYAIVLNNASGSGTLTYRREIRPGRMAIREFVAQDGNNGL